MGNKGKNKKDKEPEKKNSPVTWIVAGIVVLLAALAI